MRAIAILAALGGALLGCQPEGPWDPPEAKLPALPELRAEIVLHAGGKARTVRGIVRATDAERQVGLMYRRKRLADDEGMLFIMERDANHSFYMKNTFIPLDMVFITRDGKVAGVAADVAPRTLRSRRVGKLSRYVLELDGGWASRHGLGAGDEVDIKLLPPAP